MKRIVCLLVSVVLLVGAFSIVAYADVMTAGTAISGTGTITGDGVNFREGPGLSYTSMYSLFSGEDGALTHAYPSYPNPTWYRMRMTSSGHYGKIGWAYYSYVNAINVVVD